MITIITSIFSTIIPILLKYLSDRMETPQVEKKQNELKRLYKAKNTKEIAVAWKRHDNNLERLLLKAKAKRKR